MKNITINNIFELCLHVAGWNETEETEAARKVNHRIYRDSEEGLGILSDNEGVTITGIVEGSDAEFSTDKLIYPFKLKDFYQAKEWIEGEINAYIEENEEEE
jgi:hypothetical protein